MKTLIPVENGDLPAALRGFLARLLESGSVEALYVPLETDGGSIQPALVTNASLLKDANPFAPVMPINGARAVSAITGKQPPGRIGAVLRPCEIRALIELVKLQQASLENVTLIGIDCPGTFELPEYVAAHRSRPALLAESLAWGREAAAAAPDGLTPRPACTICLHPQAENAAIRIEWIGVDPAGGLPITLPDALGGTLGLAPSSGDDAGRRAAVQGLVAARKQAREAELASTRAQMNANGGLGSLFATCIRCHNCMTACPICYCKVCLFKSAAFDHKPDHYLNAARRKGATRLLSDTLLFQVTRMNHMSTSCVSCGMCTSACPSGIPVGAIFSTVGEQVQAAFEYQPGRSVDEPLPLITFQADEWAGVGEAK